jgi:O-antigen ligase
MLRYRLISLTSILLLLFGGAAFYATRSSRQFQIRGAAADFPQPVQGASALLLGVNADLQQFPANTLDARLTDLTARGIRYVRQEFHWAQIEPVQGQYDWQSADLIQSAARAHGIQVLPVFVTTPAWARAETGLDAGAASETMPPRDAQDFARFAQAFTQRYDTRLANGTPAILAYQIWDEPNLSAAWGDGLVNPLGYLKLLQAARSAIHAVNPGALIVLAGLAPTVEQSEVNLAPELYLRKLYEAGGQGAFDIAAAKPYGFDQPPLDRRVDAGILNYSRVILLHEEMAAHGDGQKAIWLTQWGWNANLPDWQGKPSNWGSVSEAQQAQYTTQAIQRVAREWNWAGAMFLSTLQPDAAPDDPHWGFALLDQQGQPRPVYTALTNALADAAAAPRPQWAAPGAGSAFIPKTAFMPKTAFIPNPLAQYSSGWRFSELGADIPQRDDAQLTFNFNGDALAMIVRRGDYRAYMFISIDGKRANRLPVEERGSYLILTSPDQLPHIDTVQVADGLGPGNHVAVIKIDRGWNQWTLVGWSSRAAADGSTRLADAAMPASVLVMFIALLALVVVFPRAHWGDLAGQIAPRAATLTWQSLAAALLVWLTASLTWAQDAATAYRNLGTPANLVLTGVVSGLAFWSPVFVVSLIALVALFVLVLLRLDLGLALLAFFIPFYLIPQRLFAKSFPMVEILVFMCAVAWLIRRVGKLRLEIGELRSNAINSRRLPGLHLPWVVANLSLLDWGIIALIIVAGASATQADFKVEALRELRLVILEPAILFLLLRTLKLDESQVWRIVDGFVLGAVSIAMIGLVNYARGNVFPAEFGLPRIHSVYGSPNNDALYLGRVLPLLLAVTMFSQWPWRRPAMDAGRGLAARFAWLTGLIGRRTLYALAVLPVALAIVLSASRAALLIGIPAAVVAVCILAGGRWRYIGIGVLALAGLALLVLLSGAMAPLLAHTRFANTLDLTSGTGFFRVNLWQSALVMWRDHPFLGVGPDNFLYAYRGFYIQPAAWQEPNLSHPHNIVLDFATRLGTLGLLCGIAMAVGIVNLIHRALTAPGRQPYRMLVVGLAGLFVDMVAHGMVDNAFFLVDLAFVFMLACGLLLQVRGYGLSPEGQTLTKL